MQQILYLLLFCYLLPLLVMLASAVASQMFQTDAPSVMVTAALAATFDSIRTGLGTLLIPVITAFAIELRHPSDAIPPKSKRLIVFLFTVFIVSFGLNGIIIAHQNRLTEYSPQVFEAFKNTSIFYTRELLGFISIVVVIANSKTRKRREEGGTKEKPINHQDRAA